MIGTLGILCKALILKQTCIFIAQEQPFTQTIPENASKVLHNRFQLYFLKFWNIFIDFFLPKVKFGCLKLTKSPLSGQSPFRDSQKLSLPPRDFRDNPLPGIIPLTNPATFRGLTENYDILHTLI